MGKFLTLIYPYYDNPDMFQIQQENWQNYPEDIRKDMEVIVVDDVSPNKPAIDAVLPDRNYALRLYRIKGKNIPWNWIAARNIAAHEADDGSFLLHTDIDLLWPVETITEVFKMIWAAKLGKNTWYTFDRVKATQALPQPLEDMTPYKSHPNTYLMHRDLYWKIGGYDEDFSGYYGSDGSYRKRVNAFSRRGVHLFGLKVVFYGKSIVPDSGCTEFPRKEGRDKNQAHMIKQRTRQLISTKSKPRAMSFPYERLI